MIQSLKKLGGLGVKDEVLNLSVSKSVSFIHSIDPLGDVIVRDNEVLLSMLLDDRLLDVIIQGEFLSLLLPSLLESLSCSIDNLNLSALAASYSATNCNGGGILKLNRAGLSGDCYDGDFGDDEVLDDVFAFALTYEFEVESVLRNERVQDEEDEEVFKGDYDDEQIEDNDPYVVAFGYIGYIADRDEADQIDDYQ
ncbi:MAG: hypothetical protein EZS28_036583 [Streblomastix strix]|uniref:Uncharacterized protein n=1 Tax=Streblomastix strix TaxID=222440 RepID=A0A5J4UCG8_9EUKA|nr:MAG: hypothetical protein EZS28_036583 [Streblomastix strix]